MIPWATSSLPRPAMRGIASRASTPDGPSADEYDNYNNPIRESYLTRMTTLP